MHESPFFSVIVPVWNRESMIRGCFESVLNQDFSSFELVAVDDCSCDSSLELMREFADSRVRIFQHERNMGVCAARRTATEAARGKWILSLDSDWELMPGALAKLGALAHSVSRQVGVIGGRAQTDTGEIWPGDDLPESEFGFEEFLSWAQTSKASDFLSCRRREVFETVNWPADRRLELQFNMRVAKRWTTKVSREIFAKAYTHCPNRYMTDQSQNGLRRRVERAPAMAAMYEEILTEFGDDLCRLAPHLHIRSLEAAALFAFQAGQRCDGIKHSAQVLLRRPTSLQVYGVIASGLLGPRAMAWMRSKSWIRRFSHYVCR